MKINPDCLRTVRQKKGFTRPQLEKRSGITVRTIQRLEQEPHRSEKTREDTLNRLAKALSVEPGVLTGDLPLPESDDTLTDNLDRVQIGAQIAPKARLAYDLIKRRYGVNATEIINMAPLFFTLLAESSLAWRRKKLKEAEETYDHLMQIDGFWSGGSAFIEHGMGEGTFVEEESIDRADLFGEHLDDDFDSSKNNPFTYYLRKLANELDITGIVGVDGGVLSIASNFKFPHYDICSEELDHIANGSPIARVCLETGCARPSEIPDELMAEDAGEERVQWLKKKLPDILKRDKEGVIAEFIATSLQGDEKRDILLKADSQKTDSETEKGENHE
ncbi:MAG: helix-turn-helix transcriptional regulator [Gemmatimonadetes bacterium]|nr:helix-turn-helix transcriptional regulator [Gemmatimonadota bacterium]